MKKLEFSKIKFKVITVEKYKSLQGKSLRFEIFWDIFENCQRYGFLKQLA